MELYQLRAAFLATCLLLVCSQGQAEVTVTGDVVPSGATDPWEINGSLTVGGWMKYYGNLPGIFVTVARG